MNDLFTMCSVYKYGCIYGLLHSLSHLAISIPVLSNKIINMTKFHCCVNDCHTSSTKLKDSAKYPHLEGVVLYPLPTKQKKRDRSRRKIWINQIKRATSWEPNRFTRICSLHFVPEPLPLEDPTVYPTLFPHNNFGEYLIILCNQVMYSSKYMCVFIYFVRVQLYMYSKQPKILV